MRPGALQGERGERRRRAAERELAPPEVAPVYGLATPLTRSDGGVSLGAAVEGVGGEEWRLGKTGWSALLRCTGGVECSRSELHPNAHVETEIATLGHAPAGFGLGILQIVPDERNVQVKMPLDFELERGYRMVGV